MTQNSLHTAQKTKAAVFRLGDKTFAVGISYIRKITGMMDITAVNDPEDFIRGVVNLQGQVTVVVDLAGLLGLSPMKGLPPDGRIIYIDLKKRAFGFIVDQMIDVADVPEVLDLEKVFIKFL
jgi:purine-binding chemotaxis protein CheW